MDAILLAGGTPQPDHPLYSYTQGKPRALLNMAGKPMAQWVLDALTDAEEIEHIFVVGLSPQDGLQSAKPVFYLPDQGSMLANILAGLREVLQHNPHSEFTVVASGDIPTLTPAMVNWVTANTRRFPHADVLYHVVTRETMEKRFPHANRTYLRLKDGAFCGADINVVRTTLVRHDVRFFEQLIAARKHPLRQAAMICWKILFMVATRRWTLQQVVEAVSARANVRGVGVVSPYAEMAMDADKPHQIEILRADLARR